MVVTIHYSYSIANVSFFDSHKLLHSIPAFILSNYFLFIVQAVFYDLQYSAQLIFMLVLLCHSNQTAECGVLRSASDLF